MNLEAVIKSDASAASRKTKSRGPRSREAPGQRLGKWTAAGKAELAANLITASKSRQRTPPNPNKEPLPGLKSKKRVPKS